jgi:hypothetical protein|tara:strand:- start:372 stop:515 length:144 start_codon:yes stop_codon:yes gene_type:complete
MNFWEQNKKEINKLKISQPDRYTDIIGLFRDQKIKTMENQDGKSGEN